MKSGGTSPKGGHMLILLDCPWDLGEHLQHKPLDGILRIFEEGGEAIFPADQRVAKRKEKRRSEVLVKGGVKDGHERPPVFTLAFARGLLLS